MIQKGSRVSRREDSSHPRLTSIWAPLLPLGTSSEFVPPASQTPEMGPTKGGLFGAVDGPLMTPPKLLSSASTPLTSFLSLCGLWARFPQGAKARPNLLGSASNRPHRVCPHPQLKEQGPGGTEPQVLTSSLGGLLGAVGQALSSKLPQASQHRAVGDRW